jgi:hypothetical protein
MNRPIGPSDAPLATKLASLRPELAALQTEVGTSLPTGPVAEVQQVKNDVRLPSHALLEAVLPARAPAGAPRAGDAPPSVATQWSAAARAISAVLADLHADPEPVRGTAPLWPSAQTPAAPVLAGALAQAVSGSGLFYESHLVEFANGLRTVQQLAQEPQVRLTQAPAAGAQAANATAAAPAAVQPQQPGHVVAGRPVAAEQFLPAAAVSQPVAAAALPSGSTAAQPAPGAPAQGRPIAAAPTALAQVQQPSAYTSQGIPVASVATVPVEAAMASDARAFGRDDGESNSAAPSARAAAPLAAPAEIIHPQTAALVHQQLDLLATSVFRWSGHAWPNVPMEWSVHEEEADQPADTPGNKGDGERKESPRRWSTTVSLALPRLGAVDLRLSLAGEHVQARLAASDASTVARLRGDSSQLGPRLEAVGLRLQDLQITAMSPLEHAE